VGWHYFKAIQITNLASQKASHKKKHNKDNLNIFRTIKTSSGEYRPEFTMLRLTPSSTSVKFIKDTDYTIE
jgi:hypothetical protein